MKHKYANKVYCVFVLVVCALVFIISPSKANARELPPGMVVGDDQGIIVKKDGTYLIEVNDVMPGKTWHTTISMINMEKNSTYQLNMLISPPTIAGSLDLSEAIQMTLRYEDNVVYEGPVSGINGKQSLQSEALNLGIFKGGDSRALEAEFSLSEKYTNKDFAQKNTMDNVWTFYAVKATDEPSVNEDPKVSKPFGKLPQTGEEWRQALLYTCLGLFLLLLILLLWKSKKKTSSRM